MDGAKGERLRVDARGSQQSMNCGHDATQKDNIDWRSVKKERETAVHRLPPQRNTIAGGYIGAGDTL
jgi:hypothetical protein